jgi:hypothetical protein
MCITLILALLLEYWTPDYRGINVAQMVKQGKKLNFDEEATWKAATEMGWWWYLDGSWESGF